MISRIFILFLTLLLCGEHAKSSPTYTVLAPRMLRGTSDYNVLIAFDGITTLTNMTCTLEKVNGGDSKKYIETLSILPEKRFRNFNPNLGSKWTPGQYKLTMVASGEVQFNGSKLEIPINFEYKQYIILIQTDKAIYRPGQDVQMRVVVLDDHLLPVDNDKISDLTIYIMDPQDIKLREIVMDNKLNEDLKNVNKFNFSNGVTEDITFNLHEEAQEGDWKIQAVTNGQVQNYTLFVESYILPMANITIHVPEFLSFADKRLNYSIDVLYTFGKPVHGKSEVRIRKIKECGQFIGNGYEYITNQTEINSAGQVKGQINLDNIKEFVFSKCNDYMFNISVAAFDNSTGSIYYDFDSFEVIKHEYKAEIFERKAVYRPGKDLSVKVKIQGRSGLPITKKELEDFQCQAFNVNDKSNVLTPLIPTGILFSEDGSAIECTFSTDVTFKKVLLNIVRKDDSEKFVFNQQNIKFSNCINDLIELNLQHKDEEINVGKTVKLVAKSSQNIEVAMLYIVVRGSILKSTLVNFETAGRTQLISLDITKEMVPEALVVIYMKTKGNFIISDAMKIEAKGKIYSDVIIDVKTPLVDAGNTADMIITAETESKIFLYAIDESVLALKQGNDITDKRVISQLLDNPSYLYEPDDFIRTGMIFQSNSYPECTGQYYSETDDQYKMIDIDPCTLDDSCNSKPEANNIRKNFRETWIWDETQHPHIRTGIRSEVPDSITTWKVTAFSINKEKGLGLTKNPGYVRVFRDFFVKLNLPYSIQRGEQAEINAVIFNYGNSTLDVKLSIFDNSSYRVKAVLTECDQQFKLESQQIKNINCKIECKNVGKYNITAVVNGKDTNNKVLSDGEQREILVVYEGFPREVSQSVYFDLSQVISDTNKLEETIPIKFPEDRVIGSESLFVSATSELVKVKWNQDVKQVESAHSQNRYDFTEPLACCQQRVVEYFPKAYWLDYLNITKQATPDNIIKGKEALQLTVDMLCWQNPFDGSFVYYERWSKYGAKISSEVEQNAEPSFVWQTAYALKLMLVSKKYVYVNTEKMNDTIHWLKRQMTANGIEEINKNVALYSTPTNAYLTAYVRIAMDKTGQTVDGIDDCLEKKFPGLTNKLEIMSTCYALHLANSKLQKSCFDTVLKSMQNGTSGLYWNGDNGIPDLHLTSYGLMIFVESQKRDLAFGVFKFIISCQDNNGYFHPTHTANTGFNAWREDSYITIIATEAMTKFIEFSEVHKDIAQNVFVNFEAEGKKLVEMHLNPKRDITQVYQQQPNITNLKVIAQGFGKVKVNINYVFNAKLPKDGDYHINVSSSRENNHYILLDVCTVHKTGKNKNNMMVDLYLPSGLTYHQENAKFNASIVDKIEVKDSGTRIIMYLKKIDQEGFCFTLPAIESFKMWNSRPVPIKVYPHYDRSGMSISTYKL